MHMDIVVLHDDVIKWKHFPHYWPFVRGIHRSPVNSPHKGQWRRALMFSFICVWINGWINNREAGDLRRHRVHYDVIVMSTSPCDHHSWHRFRKVTMSASSAGVNFDQMKFSWKYLTQGYSFNVCPASHISANAHKLKQRSDYVTLHHHYLIKKVWKRCFGMTIMS